MAQKDIAEKTLEAYDDVFADIVNGLLFEGRPVVAEDALSDAQPTSMYKADGRLREQERDVAKFWNGHPVRIALIGLENQTDVDRDMPLRIMGYDGTAYRAQLDGSDRYPVVTLVLYFGARRWRHRSLYDCIDVPEALKPFVSDYRINVFEVAYLSDEVIRRFRSDFGIVADYFAHSRTDSGYRPANPRAFDHQDALLKLMSVISSDPRFSETIDPKGGTPANMCEVLDRVEQRGIQLGISQGISQGISIGEMKKAREGALNLRDLGGIDNPARIARILNVHVEQVQRWFAENPAKH